MQKLRETSEGQMPATDTVQNWLNHYYESCQDSVVQSAVAGVFDALGQTGISLMEIQFVQWQQIEKSFDGLRYYPENQGNTILTVANYLMNLNASQKSAKVDETIAAVRQLLEKFQTR